MALINARVNENPTTFPAPVPGKAPGSGSNVKQILSIRTCMVVRDAWRTDPLR